MLSIFAVALILVRMVKGQMRSVFAPSKAAQGKGQPHAAVDAFNGDSMYLLGRFTDPEPAAPEPAMGITSSEARNPCPVASPKGTGDTATIS